MLRKIGVAAFALFMLLGLAESGPRAGNPPVPSVQLDVDPPPSVSEDVDEATVGSQGTVTILKLTTNAPTLSRRGALKYSAQLKCSRKDGACLASATMTLTLLDGAGGTIDTTTFTLTTASASWKTSATTTFPGAGTYCTFAHADYTTVDGGHGTIESSAPVCAAL